MLPSSLKLRPQVCTGKLFKNLLPLLHSAFPLSEVAPKITPVLPSSLQNRVGGSSFLPSPPSSAPTCGSLLSHKESSALAGINFPCLCSFTCLSFPFIRGKLVTTKGSGNNHTKRDGGRGQLERSEDIERAREHRWKSISIKGVYCLISSSQ